MQQSKSEGTRKNNHGREDQRLNTTPDYVNIGTATNNDDVFYVNIGEFNDKKSNVKSKNGIKFEKYDDKVTNNYLEVEGMVPYRISERQSPYVNLSRRIDEDTNRRKPSNSKSRMEYVDLDMSKFANSDSNSPSSSSRSSSIHSPTYLSPKNLSSVDYVQIDPNATGAIRRSISEHREEKVKKNSRSKK